MFQVKYIDKRWAVVDNQGVVHHTYRIKAYAEQLAGLLREVLN